MGKPQPPAMYWMSLIDVSSSFNMAELSDWEWAVGMDRKWAITCKGPTALLTNTPRKESGLLSAKDARVGYQTYVF